MKFTKIIRIAALALFILIVSACGQKPLLENVSVSPTTITPNADGQTDLTTCWAREAERSENEMNRVYLALLQELPERAARFLDNLYRGVEQGYDDGLSDFEIGGYGSCHDSPLSALPKRCAWSALNKV